MQNTFISLKVVPMGSHATLEKVVPNDRDSAGTLQLTISFPYPSKPFRYFPHFQNSSLEVSFWFLETETNHRNEDQGSKEAGVLENFPLWPNTISQNVRYVIENYRDEPNIQESTVQNQAQQIMQ